MQKQHTNVEDNEEGIQYFSILRTDVRGMIDLRGRGPTYQYSNNDDEAITAYCSIVEQYDTLQSMMTDWRSIIYTRNDKKRNNNQLLTC